LETIQSILPKTWDGNIECVGNQEKLNLEKLLNGPCETALVYVDGHEGAENAIHAARRLRTGGIQTGLVAHCAHHWSWRTARCTSPDDPRAVAAAAVEGELCHEANVVVVPTRRTADVMALQHHLGLGRCCVISNSTLVNGSLPAFAQRTRGLVLYAGRLEREKRVELLIRAVGMGAKTCPELRLVVIGEGSLEADLRATAKAYRSPVEFRPKVDHAELLREMGRCGVYAQVSSFESHSETIVEAMAMGAPVLVTRAPGVDDEINPNVTGIVTGDAEADIAGGLVWLHHNPEVAQRLGARAAKDIRSRLSFDATFAKLEECFRRAMDLAGANAAVVTPSRDALDVRR
jgi:glycosyltransferase involved in cell wall biosynthesis